MGLIAAPSMILVFASWRRPSSSRLQSGFLNAAVLAEQSIRVISVDRPGYGQSSPHRTSTVESFAGAFLLQV